MYLFFFLSSSTSTHCGHLIHELPTKNLLEKRSSANYDAWLVGKNIREG